MIKLMLNYQYRKRLFLIPAMLLIVGIFPHYYIIIFLLLQKRFTNIYHNSDFNLSLFNITGKDLGSYLKIYNLSWIIWFNMWVLTAKLLSIIFMNISIQMVLAELVNFNIVMLAGFISGNLISNSDLITISGSFFRSLGSSFIFSLVLAVTYLMLYIISMTKVSSLNLFLLFFSGITWFISTGKQTHIKYIQYYYD